MKYTLALAFSSLLIPAVAAAQERVSFPSTDGDLKGGTPTTITGYLYKPAASGPFAAVVGMHGCDGLVDDKREMRPLYGQWGEILSRAGYFVLLVDGRPRGQSNLCLMQPISIRPILPWRETVREPFGGLNYMRSRPDVKPDSVAIMGQSYGGLAMMFTIANGALPEQEFRAAVAIYPNCVPIPSQDAHWRSRVPMLLLMGEFDPSLLACNELVAQATKEGSAPIDVHLYPDTYHAFDWSTLPARVVTDIKVPPDGHPLIIGSNPVARADAINRVTQFLSKQLR